MFEILLHGFPKTGGLMVEDTMLFAHLLHNGLDVRVMAVVDAREEMVFDLKVETAGEQERCPT